LRGPLDTTGHEKTLVVGLGNPILGDDGVGWRVCQSAEEHWPVLANIQVTFECYSCGGLELMERLVGYDRAILIDAFQPGQSESNPEAIPARVVCCAFDEIASSQADRLRSAHDASLATALRVGKELGAHLPSRIDVVGIETQAVLEFTEELTPAVTAAIPLATNLVFQLISGR